MKSITLKLKNFNKLTDEDLRDILDLGCKLSNGEAFEKDTAAAIALYSEILKYAPLYDKPETRAALALVENNYADCLSREEDPEFLDLKKAMELFASSANKNCGLAMANIGFRYEHGFKDKNGYEIEQDYKEALKWYRKSAIVGEPKGMFNLGNMYHWGWGVKKDPEIAFSLYRTLVERYDHTESYFYIGYYYEHGKVVEKDEEFAFKAYLCGAQRNDNYCCNEVGRCLCEGIGVEKNPVAGYSWYIKAGELGDPLGYTNAAYLLETGAKGIEINLARSKELYELAAEQGEEHAIEALARLAKEEKSQQAKNSSQPKNTKDEA